MPYERNEAELQRDLEGMKNPSSWPRWPVLPVKRHTEERGIEVGILAEQDMTIPVEPVVYQTNMIGLKTWKDVFDAPQLRYDSFEALIADGWVVD